jgi:acyl carrier protein
MTNIEAGVRELIEEFLGEAPADALAPLELASLTLVEIVTELEERFGLTVNASDVNPQNFRSISSITAYVTKHQRG